MSLESIDKQSLDLVVSVVAATNVNIAQAKQEIVTLDVTYGNDPGAIYFVCRHEVHLESLQARNDKTINTTQNSAWRNK